MIVAPKPSTNADIRLFDPKAIKGAADETTDLASTGKVRSLKVEALTDLDFPITRITKPDISLASFSSNAAT